MSTISKIKHNLWITCYFVFNILIIYHLCQFRLQGLQGLQIFGHISMPQRKLLFKKKKMNCSQAKKISIIGYLENLGIRPSENKKWFGLV